MIDTLKKICNQFPGVTEDLKWGADLCFCIGAKIFCGVGIEAPHHFSFKCTEEQFRELIEREGIKPAKYTGKYHWVSVVKTGALRKDELEALLETAYTIVKNKLPKKIQAQIADNKKEDVSKVI